MTLCFALAACSLAPPQSAKQDTHRFFDTHARIASAATIGLLATDSAITVNSLRHGGHEDWIKSQKPHVVVLTLSLNKLACWSGAYIAHRTNHHKIERLFEWAGPAYSTAGIASTLSKR